MEHCHPGQPNPGCSNRYVLSTLSEKYNLEREQSHGGEPDPRVETVEVGDGRWVALDGPQIVGVEHGDEGDGDARDGEDVEHRVQQLVPDPAAAAASAVHEHRCNEK